MEAGGTSVRNPEKETERPAPKWIHQSIARIAEVLILAEPEDTPPLENARNQLQKIGAWIEKHRSAELSGAVQASVGVLDGVVSGEGSVPAAALDVVRRAVGALQEVLIDGRDPRRVSFPAELTAAMVIDGSDGAPADTGDGEEPTETIRRPEALHSDIDDAIFADFLSQQVEIVDELEEFALELEKNPDESIVKALKGLLHTLKGDSSVLGLDDVERVCHSCEDLLEAAPPSGLTDHLLEVKDWLGSIFAYYTGKAGERPGATDLLDRLVAATGDQLDSVAASSQNQSKSELGAEGDRPDDVGADCATKRSDAQRTATVRETVKIDAERLDRLLDTIGELVIAESMVCQSDEFNPASSPELDRRRMQLDKITRTLQVMSTSLRMVPVRPVFLKMARLVRDLAIKADKKIEFVMSGENTELDKAVVDRIGDPLLHVLRNAVDHGIESTSERRAAAKEGGGRIELRAFHRGGSIFIEVTDDGRGLDRDSILAKARDRGLIPADVEPTDDEIFACVFEPGFSTAEKITDVSGRGVGLDVVHRAVEELRGQVNLRSTPGGGCLISIRLPLSLAIIDGMVVSVGDERYIIPTLSVVRFIRPESSQLSTVVARGEILAVEGAMLPLFRLDRLLEIERAIQDPCRALAVVVEDNGRLAAVLVDSLLGQQQIVIKGIGDLVHGVRGVAGGAIMPDGHVGLILDVAGLVALAHSNDGDPAKQIIHTDSVPSAPEGSADGRASQVGGKSEVRT